MRLAVGQHEVQAQAAAEEAVEAVEAVIMMMTEMSAMHAGAAQGRALPPPLQASAQCDAGHPTRLAAQDLVLVRAGTAGRVQGQGQVHLLPPSVCVAMMMQAQVEQWRGHTDTGLQAQAQAQVACLVWAVLGQLAEPLVQVQVDDDPALVAELAMTAMMTITMTATVTATATGMELLAQVQAQLLLGQALQWPCLVLVLEVPATDTPQL